MHNIRQTWHDISGNELRRKCHNLIIIQRWSDRYKWYICDIGVMVLHWNNTKKKYSKITSSQVVICMYLYTNVTICSNPKRTHSVRKCSISKTFTNTSTWYSLLSTSKQFAWPKNFKRISFACTSYQWIQCKITPKTYMHSNEFQVYHYDHDIWNVWIQSTVVQFG